MALDNFRRIDIILDNINNKLDLPYKLKASTGDWNGRMLFVQVTNNGIIEEQKANLHLGFRHTEDEKITGLYQFKVENAEEGIYKVAYPREMLELAGVVVCGIRIIDSGDNIICATEDFSVEVMRSVFSGEMEVAENSIRVFDKMILDINAHERRVSVMELNFKELYKMLTTNIPNMDMAISTRASQSSVDKLSSNMADKMNDLAPKSTALSTVVWNNNLAADLSSFFGKNFVRQRLDKSTSVERWNERHYGIGINEYSTILSSVGKMAYIDRLFISSYFYDRRYSFKVRLTVDDEVYIFQSEDNSQGSIVVMAVSKENTQYKTISSGKTIEYRGSDNYKFLPINILTENMIAKNKLLVEAQITSSKKMESDDYKNITGNTRINLDWGYSL